MDVCNAAVPELKVNEDKTQLLVFITRQKRRYVDINSMTIITTISIVTTSYVEGLLGAHILEDMRWKNHVMTNEDKLTMSLTNR